MRMASAPNIHVLTDINPLMAGTLIGIARLLTPINKAKKFQQP